MATQGPGVTRGSIPGIAGYTYIYTAQQCGNLYGDTMPDVCGSSDYVSAMSTSWTTPTGSPTQSGITTYLWSGVQDSIADKDGTAQGWLVQSVVQYGASAAGGGNWWSSFNMVVYDDNNVYYYTPAWPPAATGWGPTCSGVTISAQQYQYTGYGNYEFCSYYTGACQLTPDNEPLCVGTAPHLNIAVPAAFEVSNWVTNCAQLPAPNGGTPWTTSIQYIKNSSGTNIANGADMVGVNRAPSSPNCNFAVYTPTTTGTSLWY